MVDHTPTGQAQEIGQAQHASQPQRASQPTPGVVIAAMGSGSGKTTIATGLMAALAQRMQVAAFKVGPDYIDPSYHSLAAGTRGRNLDSVLCPPDLIGPLYAHGSQNADISIIEGVMGLFDGRITTAADQNQGSPGQLAPELAAGSTAEIAALLGMPVILVLDVRGMSHTVGAVVHGLAIEHPEVRIAGVILNKVGSPRHAAVCREAIEGYGITVLGAIPRVAEVQVPSRHLGLITSGEWDTAVETITAMAQMVEEYVDIPALIELAGCTHSFKPWDANQVIQQQLPTADADLPMPAISAAVGSAPAQLSDAINSTAASTAALGSASATPLRIAMAAGPAFSFTYAEHIELLQALGCEIVEFDPLTQDFPECAGLIIPGGFPEEYCEQLAARPCQDTMRAAIKQGLPVHAECAGLLWLLDSLAGHPMVGVVPFSAAMAKLTLGYREAVALQDSVVYRSGQRILGHEFHHTQLTANAGQDDLTTHRAWAWRTWQGEVAQEGWVDHQIHASYLHVHPAAYPQAMVRFVQHCLAFQAAQGRQD